MRGAAVLVFLLFTPWGAAYAQTDEEPPPGCSRCDLLAEPPPEPEALVQERRNLWKIMATGLAAIALGQTFVFAYAAEEGRPSTKLLAAIPVAGAVAITARDQPQTGWRSGLAFSVLLQAAGTILVAASGTALHDLRVRPGVSAWRDGASVDVDIRF